MSATAGRIAFVGFVPGAPQLITVSAHEMLTAADVVVLHEDQGADELAAWQLEANVVMGSRLTSLASLAEPDRRIVVLVAGDPLTHSAIAQQAAECAVAGHAVEFVPGLDRAQLVSSLTGAVPTADAVQYVSLDQVPPPELRWAPTGTLVVTTTRSLVAHAVEVARSSGRTETEPTLVVRGVHRPDQSSALVTLGEAAATASQLGSASDPQVWLVIGHRTEGMEHGVLNWFENSPLRGWRVLVPRTREQAGPILDRLAEWGAEPVEVATAAVEPPRSPVQLDRAIHGLVEGAYEWVAFTSATAVRAVLEKFEANGLDARAFSGLRIATVGATTADSLLDWGIRPDLMVTDATSVTALAAEFPSYDEALDPINRVFLPRADIATEELKAQLIELGWEVDDVVAYRTVRAAPPPAEVRDDIKQGRFDAVTFTSSSSVRNLLGIAGKPHPVTVIAAVGPKTAETCREHGLRVDAIADDASPRGLADALACFATERREAALAAQEQPTRPSHTPRRNRRRTS